MDTCGASPTGRKSLSSLTSLLSSITADVTPRTRNTTSKTDALLDLIDTSCFNGTEKDAPIDPSGSFKTRKTRKSDSSQRLFKSTSLTSPSLSLSHSQPSWEDEEERYDTSSLRESYRKEDDWSRVSGDTDTLPGDRSVAEHTLLSKSGDLETIAEGGSDEASTDTATVPSIGSIVRGFAESLQLKQASTELVTNLSETEGTAQSVGAANTRTRSVDRSEDKGDGASHSSKDTEVASLSSDEGTKKEQHKENIACARDTFSSHGKLTKNNSLTSVGIIKTENDELCPVQDDNSIAGTAANSIKSHRSDLSALTMGSDFLFAMFSEDENESNGRNERESNSPIQPKKGHVRGGETSQTKAKSGCDIDDNIPAKDPMAQNSQIARLSNVGIDKYHDTEQKGDGSKVAEKSYIYSWKIIEDGAESKSYLGSSTLAILQASVLRTIQNRAWKGCETLVASNPELLRLQSPDLGNKTLLHILASAGDVPEPLMLRLISLNPSIVRCTDCEGNLALHYTAAVGNNPGLVRLLVDFCRAGTDIKNVDGNTPLHLTASLGKLSDDTLQILVEANPEMICIQNKNGETPLHRACSATNPSIKSTKTLLMAHLSSNTITSKLDNAGNSPLHNAIRSKASNKIISAFVNYDKDTGSGIFWQPDDSGKLPLHIALTLVNADSTVVASIISACPSVCTRTFPGDGKCLVQKATEQKMPSDIIASLLEADLPIELRKKDGLGAPCVVNRAHHHSWWHVAVNCNDRYLPAIERMLSSKGVSHLHIIALAQSAGGPNGIPSFKAFSTNMEGLFRNLLRFQSRYELKVSTQYSIDNGVQTFDAVDHGRTNSYSSSNITRDDDPTNRPWLSDGFTTIQSEENDGNSDEVYEVKLNPFDENERTVSIRFYYNENAFMREKFARHMYQISSICESVISMHRCDNRIDLPAFIVFEKPDHTLDRLIDRASSKKTKAQSKWHQRCSTLLRQVANAIAFMHKRGAIHGSIDPSNIALFGKTWKLRNVGHLTLMGVPLSGSLRHSVPPESIVEVQKGPRRKTIQSTQKTAVSFSECISAKENDNKTAAATTETINASEQNEVDLKTIDNNIHSVESDQPVGNDQSITSRDDPLPSGSTSMQQKMEPNGNPRRSTATQKSIVEGSQTTPKQIQSDDTSKASTATGVSSMRGRSKASWKSSVEQGKAQTVARHTKTSSKPPIFPVSKTNKPRRGRSKRAKCVLFSLEDMGIGGKEGRSCKEVGVSGYRSIREVPKSQVGNAVIEGASLSVDGSIVGKEFSAAMGGVSDCSTVLSDLHSFASKESHVSNGSRKSVRSKGSVMSRGSKGSKSKSDGSNGSSRGGSTRGSIRSNGSKSSNRSKESHKSWRRLGWTSDSSSVRSTASSSVVQNLRFVPEGVNASPMWDIWAFGLVMVSLLIGRCSLLPNFEKAEDALLLRLHQFDEGTLKEIRKRVEVFAGSDAADCVSMLLHPSPEKRAKSMKEVLSHPFFCNTEEKKES